MFGKHHTWTVYQGNGSVEACVIQQDDSGAYSGANVYLPGVQKFGVSTANYIIRVQDKGKDFQVTTKQGQLLAEVLHNWFLVPLQLLASRTCIYNADSRLFNQLFLWTLSLCLPVRGLVWSIFLIAEAGDLQLLALSLLVFLDFEQWKMVWYSSSIIVY